MNDESSIVVRIRRRIEAENAVFNGTMPERYALAWHGYIAALLEWGLIEVYQYKNLHNLLPLTEKPDPILNIFLGREQNDL